MPEPTVMSEPPYSLWPDVRQVQPLQDGAEIDLIVPSNLRYFQGHFPDLGILPGVVQLHWAVALAKQHLGVRIAGRALQVKFRKTISPGAELTLVLREDIGRGRLTFEYRDGGTVASSGQLTTEAP